MAEPQTETLLAEIDQARIRWLSASEHASAATAEMHLNGGYGCPEAYQEDLNRREAARLDAERMFREYQDFRSLGRLEIEPHHQIQIDPRSHGQDRKSVV